MDEYPPDSCDRYGGAWICRLSGASYDTSSGKVLRLLQRLRHGGKVRPDAGMRGETAFIAYFLTYNGFGTIIYLYRQAVYSALRGDKAKEEVLL